MMEITAPDFSALLTTLLDGRETELTAFLTPVLLLITWTLIMWFWMYATRIPAMVKGKVNADKAAKASAGYLNELLPYEVRVVADNYNHLHEQPTLFYALMVFAALTGGGDTTMLYLAYAYVGLRVVHTLMQVVLRKIIPRFAVFSLSSFVLIAMTVKELIRVFL